MAKAPSSRDRGRGFDSRYDSLLSFTCDGCDESREWADGGTEEPASVQAGQEVEGEAKAGGE